jgi:opacity protein-like surface antigen
MKNVKNIFKGIFAASLLTATSLASAGWTVSGGYVNYNEDDEGIDISVDAVYASVGYEYESGNMVFMPEIRLGTGVGDDNVMGVEVEIDSVFAASIRGQYNITEQFAVFLQPSYARIEATARFEGQSVTEDDWEFGFGGGAAFKVSKSFSIEAIYENYDNSDVVSIGARYTF